MDKNPYAAPSVDPTANPTGKPGVEGPRDWGIWEVIGVAWETFKQNMGMLIGGFVLMVVCVYALIIPIVLLMLPAAGFGASTAPSSQYFESMVTGMMLLYPVMIAAEVFFFIGWFRFCLAALRGEALSLGTIFSGGKRLVPTFFAFVLVYICSMVGMFFLIVPGFIVGLGLSMVVPLVVDSKLSISEAMSASWEAMKGHKFRLFLFWVVTSILTMLFAIVTLYLGMLFVLPLLSLAFAEIYMCVTGRRSAES